MPLAHLWAGPFPYRDPKDDLRAIPSRLRALNEGPSFVKYLVSLDIDLGDQYLFKVIDHLLHGLVTG